MWLGQWLDAYVAVAHEVAGVGVDLQADEARRGRRWRVGHGLCVPRSRRCWSGAVARLGTVAAVLRSLPGSCVWWSLARSAPLVSGDRRDAENLTLRHQILVLQRPVARPRFTDADPTILALLSQALDCAAFPWPC